MTILINIVRVLIILLIIRIVVSWVMGARRTVGAGAGRFSGRPRPVGERAGGTLVRDPNCGTFLPESRAITVGSLHFCSAACRDAYRNRVSGGNPAS